MKRFSRLALVLALILSLACAPEVSAAEVASGTCGEGLTWTLDDQGTLIVSGSGAMDDYRSGASPWSGKRSSITKVVVEEGVTYLGRYSFSICSSLTGATLPDSLTGIGAGCFDKCRKLTSISFPKYLWVLFCMNFMSKQ